MSGLWFLAGLALLIGGAEWLVRGASRLAAAAGIPPLLIGLTVVAFGTSAPELAVTIGAARSGQADLAVGNVVGSNIFNVLFILGAAALISPLVVSRQLVRLDVPLLIGVSLGVLVLAWDGEFGRRDGTVLCGGLLAYLLLLVRIGRREAAAAAPPTEEGAAPAAEGRSLGVSTLLRDIVAVVGGLLLLVLGARLLVDAAVTIARTLGVSEMIIGLTLAAAGTSLPEVVTSITASLRGERDIAVGNVVGSNLFNLMGVLGLGALLAPSALPVAAGTLAFDLPVMVAVAVACLPIFFTGHLIARWEGALFLAFYVAYVIVLAAEATGAAGLRWVGPTMLWFVLPLTFVTLLVLALRTSRTGSSP